MYSRTYTELSQIDTFKERYEYLRLDGRVSEVTFGFDRWMNQQFYTSSEWRRTRNLVIARDNGCDLGVEGHETTERFIVHHMNPMRPEDLVHGNIDILNPEYLISAVHNTHNAIHFGDSKLLPEPYVERRPNDTIPWR